jgi:hypothetical protein
MSARELDRFVDLDWEEPPSTLLDVTVVVVYEDGETEHVDDRHLQIRPDGLSIEGHPLRRERVLQVEVEYAESDTPLDKLGRWLRGLPETVRQLPEDYRRWRRERRR